MADLGVQLGGGAFGAVLVHEAQADARHEDGADHDGVGLLAEEEGDQGGAGQQHQQRGAQLAQQHGPGPGVVGADRVRTRDGQAAGRLPLVETGLAAVHPAQHLGGRQGGDLADGHTSLAARLRRSQPAHGHGTSM